MKMAPVLRRRKRNNGALAFMSPTESAAPGFATSEASGISAVDQEAFLTCASAFRDWFYQNRSRLIRCNIAARELL